MYWNLSFDTIVYLKFSYSLVNIHQNCVSLRKRILTTWRVYRYIGLVHYQQQFECNFVCNPASGKCSMIKILGGGIKT